MQDKMISVLFFPQRFILPTIEVFGVVFVGNVKTLTCSFVCILYTLSYLGFFFFFMNNEISVPGKSQPRQSHAPQPVDKTLTLVKFRQSLCEVNVFMLAWGL